MKKLKFNIASLNILNHLNKNLKLIWAKHNWKQAQTHLAVQLESFSQLSVAPLRQYADENVLVSPNSHLTGFKELASFPWRSLEVRLFAFVPRALVYITIKLLELASFRQLMLNITSVFVIIYKFRIFKSLRLKWLKGNISSHRSTQTRRLPSEACRELLRSTFWLKRFLVGSFPLKHRTKPVLFWIKVTFVNRWIFFLLQKLVD